MSFSSLEYLLRKWMSGDLFLILILADLIQQPSEDQGGLRGAFSISPEQLESTYQKQGLPGFGPEIMYFSEEKGKDVNPYEGWMAEEYGFNRAGEPLTKKRF